MKCIVLMLTLVLCVLGVSQAKATSLLKKQNPAYPPATEKVQAVRVGVILIFNERGEVILAHRVLVPEGEPFLRLARHKMPPEALRLKPLHLKLEWHLLSSMLPAPGLFQRFFQLETTQLAFSATNFLKSSHWSGERLALNPLRFSFFSPIQQ